MHPARCSRRHGEIEERAMMDGAGSDSIITLQAGNSGEIVLPEGVSLTNAEFS